MSDAEHQRRQGWAETGERLRVARMEAGYLTAKAFATEAGLNSAVYYGHENGNRPLTHATAKSYAKLLKVPVHWLMFGNASQGRGRCRIVGTIGNKAQVKLFGDDPAVPRTIPHINDDLDVYEVVGDDNLPMGLANGDFVYCRPLVEGSFHPLHVNGQECVVMLESGETMFRKVLIEAGGTATLIASDGTKITGARLLSASPIDLIRKARSVPREEKPAKPPIRAIETPSEELCRTESDILSDTVDAYA